MKQSAYAARPQQNFAFTANSRWTAERFRQSALVAGRRVELIHYGLDQSVYHPRNREAAREALGIGKEEAVVCFAAHDLSYYRKGGHKLSEALLALKSDRSIRLLTMGGGELAVASQYNHTHFHQINSDHLQGLIYRASDVFVIPSLEEAFGQTALEAIACGTVVAGFKVGGIVDIVQIGLNGQLANPGQSDALCQAIGNLLENSQLRDEWKEHCFNWVSDHFSFSRNAASYIRLYESLLNVQSGN